MLLSEQDSGRSVNVNLGSLFSVRLKENPTTGYRWTVESASGLEQVGDHFEGGGAIGAAGIRQLQFRAIRAGSSELRMKNWQEWEGEASVISRFVVEVIVSEGH